MKEEKPKKPRGNQMKVFQCVPVDGTWIDRVVLRNIVFTRGFKGSYSQYEKAVWELLYRQDIEASENKRAVRRAQIWLFD